MKGVNEKYCNECASVISKNAYICPHCGVKQSGINIDTEKISKTVKAGSWTFIVSLVSFIRWASRTAIVLAPICGAIAAFYFYNDRSEYSDNWWGEGGFYVSIAVIIIAPIVSAMICSKASSFLKKFDL